MVSSVSVFLRPRMFDSLIFLWQSCESVACKLDVTLVFEVISKLA